jgi:hypothetical protein
METPSERGPKDPKTDLLEILQSLDRNAQGSYPSDLLRGDLAENIVIGLAARARGLFRSVVYLLKHDQAEEGAILLRSLFSDSPTRLLPPQARVS